MKKSIKQLDKYTKQHWYSFLLPEPQVPFINKDLIDKYIDNFWEMNCPNNYSQHKIDMQVRELIHQLIMQEKMCTEEVNNDSTKFDSSDNGRPSSSQNVRQPQNKLRYKEGKKKFLSMYNLDKHSVMDKYRRYQRQPSSINAPGKRNYNDFYNK